MINHRSLLQVQMDDRNAQFQQQLQDKNDEINKLRRELETLRGEVHIVSTGLDGRIKVHKSTADQYQK